MFEWEVLFVMSNGGEQNGVQYVVSLPGQEKRLSLKKVNLKHIPPSAVTQIVKCTKLTALTHASNSSSANIKRSIDNNEELTVISGIDCQDQGNGKLHENEVLNIEKVPKRMKTDVSMQSLRNSMKDSTVGRSDLIGNDKISDDIGTDDEWDEDTLDEFDNVSDTYINQPSQPKTGKKRRASKDETQYYTDNSFKSRRVHDIVDKKKGKPKLFRAEWLNIDIFRDWLARDPTNPSKARCLACNTTMNAGKSELEKHATGARHCQNVQVMQNQQMLLYQEGEEEVSDVMTNVEVLLSDEEPVAGDDLQSHYQEQQLEALNKIATSVDNLASNVTVFFEKMCSNQETLIQVLQQLVSK